MYGRSSPFAKQRKGGPPRQLLLSCELADQNYLRFSVGGSVGMEQFVEPDWRLVQNVRMLPGVPGQVRLRLTGYEPPIDGSDPFLFCDGQNRVEGAAYGAGHVFGADHRPGVFLQPCYLAL